MPYSTGTKTVNKGFLNVENHKMTETFTVAASNTIYEGMPVVLDATGKVVAAGADGANAPAFVIGYALGGALAGEEVTVLMKCSAILYVQTDAAINPTEDVEYDGYDTNTGYNIVSKTSVTNSVGKVLDVAGASGAIVRIALI